MYWITIEDHTCEITILKQPNAACLHVSTFLVVLFLLAIEECAMAGLHEGIQSIAQLMIAALIAGSESEVDDHQLGQP